MPFKTADRVFETSQTTGAGEYVLDGAQVGFQPFSVLGANNLCPYFATDDVNWEVGVGTVLAGPNRLQRTTILASSNGGAAVNWGVGSKKIRCGQAAGLAVPRTLSKAVGGGAGTTVLTQDEQRRDVLKFTGVLTGNRIIEVDATEWKWASIENATTGNFTLTVRVTGQVGIVVPQGGSEPAWCDGVDVRRIRRVVGTDGYPLVPVVGAVDGLAYLPPALGYNIVGGYLAWTVGGNVLTVAIKTWAGNDPSAAEPVFIAFRNVTAADGSLTYRKITAATSIAINDTALLGTTNNVPFRLWCVAFDDGGVIRLGLINCLSGTSIFPLAGWGIASSTLEDNASDNDHVFYTAGAAVAAKAYATLGYGTWEAGLAVAGTWSAEPTRKQLFGTGVPLPGHQVQEQVTFTSAAASGTTIMPADDTIPQSTEGDQYFSQAITPSSAANVLDMHCEAFLTNTVANDVCSAAIFQDATANALAALATRNPGAGQETLMVVSHRMRAGTTAATTLKVRMGGANAGTRYVNANNVGTRRFGGVAASNFRVRELMA